MAIHLVPAGQSNRYGKLHMVRIETGRSALHPSKVFARVKEVGASKEWKGPWDDEATAIRSICQIYSIGGP